MDHEFCGIMVCLLNNKESTWVDKSKELVPGLNVHMDFEEFKKSPGPKLLLVHFEQLPRDIKKLARYKKFNWAGIDEGHRIANRGSKQSKAAARLSWIRRKLILTGTPIEQKPSDMFAQFRFLAPFVFGTNWGEFEQEYMDFDKIDMTGVRPGTARWQEKMLKQRILKSRAEFRADKVDQFSGLIYPYCFRLTKEDVGIKPPKVHKVTVNMLGRQRRCYEEMDQDRVTRLPDGRLVVADMEVTAIMKRRQIASGFIYDENEELTWLGGAKARKAMELVRSLKKPIVIFTAFKPDTDYLEKKLLAEGYSVAKVYGKTKKKLRPDIWRTFQKAQYDVAVCQIRTGGVGVDLWKANSAIVYSMGHSYIDWDQAKARMDAGHKKNHSDIYVLCSKNTVDEELYDLVLKKHLTSKQVLNRLRRRYQHGKERQSRNADETTKTRVQVHRRRRR